VILPVNSETREPVRPEQRLYYDYASGAPSRELLLPELWRMLRLRWRVIGACVSACLLLASGYIVIKDSRYQATARIEVSPAGTNSMGLDEVSSRILSPSDPTLQLQSAVTVLESSTVALAVMQQTKLAERKDFAGRWTQPAGADVATLSPEARDHLLLRFQKNLKIEIVPKTDIISVQFRAKDPALAAEAVNATVSSYAERNFRSSYDSAAQVSNWLSSQMEDLKLKANQAQEKLAALQKKRGLIGVDETDNIVTDKLKDLNEQLTAAESDRIVKEARYRIAGSGNPELIASAIPEPTLQVLRSQQAQLRVDYAKLSTKFGEGYPKVAELGSEMAQVDSAIAAELKNLSERYKNEYLAAAGAEKMLQAKFEQQKQKAYDISEGAAQYAILKHEVETSQDLYTTLQLKLKQAGIVAGLASANIGVVETGQVPSEPVDPKPLLDLALGLGGGLALGFGAALTLQVLDNSIRDAEDAEQVSGLPVLAEVPQLNPMQAAHGRLFRKAVSPALRLIAHCEPLSAVAESYRSLRTSLVVSSGQRPQVLAVTSAMPGEGKSLTSINLAVVLAQQGASVLLADADLRQPSIHTPFQLAQEHGLADLLAGTASQAECMAHSDSLPNLFVLTAGAQCASPAETLASAGLSSLLAGWRSRFDYVVLDTPPVAMFTDAAVLGAQADAVLLVARYGVTTKYALRHAADLLRRTNANLTGVVLNGIDSCYESLYYRRYGYGLAAKRQGAFEA
jgi:succinoglycan biosynthesis transport protein ExoP